MRRAALSLLPLAALALRAPRALAQYDLPTTRACGTRPVGLGTAPVGRPQPTDVMVLAFRGSSAKIESPYLGVGLATGVAARLDALSSVELRSTAPLRRPEPTGRGDVLAAGLETGARFLVAGALAQGPKEVNITVRIYRAADGRLVSSDDLSAPNDSTMALEARIAAIVARRLAPALTAADRRGLSRLPTRSSTAFDHLLIARALLAERTPMSVASAVRVLESATEIDPAFAEAQALRATGYAELLTRGWQSLNLPPEKLIAAGIAASERAVAAAPNSVAAWVARGRLLLLQQPQQPERAWAAFDRALELAPRSADAWHAYGRARLDAGDFAGAQERLRRAAELDPDYSAALVDAADIQLLRRDYAGACEWLNAALAADPWNPFAYTLRALVRLRMSETRDAWGDAETAVQLGRALDGQAALAVVYAHARDSVKAQARIKRFLPPRGSVDTRPLSAWEGRLLALAALAGGDAANAVNFLERVRPRAGALWVALQDPGFDALRADRRFAGLATATRPAGAGTLVPLAPAAGIARPKARESSRARPVVANASAKARGR